MSAKSTRWQAFAHSYYDALLLESKDALVVSAVISEELSFSIANYKLLASEIKRISQLAQGLL